MDTPSTISAKGFFVLVASLLAIPMPSGWAQEVETLELATSVVHPLTARLGSACLIELPVEPVATNVGDAQMWLIEKAERTVSLKPIQAGARDTTLAILTRQGTLNFAVHLGSASEPFTQNIRVTKILDDSKPWGEPATLAQETAAERMIRELRIAQNYHALKDVRSPELREVESSTQLREEETPTHACSLLQSFRFRDSRHIVLHFILKNKLAMPLFFETRKTTVSVAETLFAPLAVSLGQNPILPGGSSENFIILDGSQGLSPRNAFSILLEPIDSTRAP